MDTVDILLAFTAAYISFVILVLYKNAGVWRRVFPKLPTDMLTQAKDVLRLHGEIHRIYHHMRVYPDAYSPDQVERVHSYCIKITMLLEQVRHNLQMQQIEQSLSSSVGEIEQTLRILGMLSQLNQPCTKSTDRQAVERLDEELKVGYGSKLNAEGGFTLALEKSSEKSEPDSDLDRLLEERLGNLEPPLEIDLEFSEENSEFRE
jgi:hypothetical protein